MKRKRFRRRLARGLALMVVAVAVAVIAASTAYAAPTPEPDPTEHLKTIVDNATVWVMGILAGIATFFATLGGVRHVLAGGDPGEIERAKLAYKSAGLGYVLAAMAPLLVSIVKSILGIA